MLELWRMKQQTKDSNGSAQVTSGFMWAWPSRRVQHFVSQLAARIQITRRCAALRCVVLSCSGSVPLSRSPCRQADQVVTGLRTAALERDVRKRCLCLPDVHAGKRHGRDSSLRKNNVAGELGLFTEKE